MLMTSQRILDHFAPESLAQFGPELPVSQATFYQWQRKYGGMAVADLKRLKELESDLALAQRVVAELTMQNRILKDVIEKKL